MNLALPFAELVRMMKRSRLLTNSVMAPERLLEGASGTGTITEASCDALASALNSCFVLQSKITLEKYVASRVCTAWYL
jgi:hypothetical protein